MDYRNIILIFVSHKTIELMKTYEFCLYNKKHKYLIDNILIPNCKDRKDALLKSKNILLLHGLTINEFGYTLKETKKVKESLLD